MSSTSKHPQTLIGFGCRHDLGSSRFIRQLEQRHGYHQTPFVAAIRSMLLEIDPFVLEAGTGEAIRLSVVVKTKGWDQARDEHAEVSRLLRFAGHAGRSVISPLAWVQIVMRQAAELDHCVIPDVRNSEEFASIRAAGGLLVRIVRPGPPSGEEDALAGADWDVLVIDDTENDSTASVADSLHRFAHHAELWAGKGAPLRASALTA